MSGGRLARPPYKLSNFNLIIESTTQNQKSDNKGPKKKKSPKKKTS